MSERNLRRSDVGAKFVCTSVGTDPSDDEIYTCMPRAFKRVYSILRVAMFVVKEIVEKRWWGNWGGMRACVHTACRTYYSVLVYGMS